MRLRPLPRGESCTIVKRMDYRSTSDNVHPATAQAWGALTWLITFPDVEELSSLASALPSGMHGVDAQWLHGVACANWEGHCAFDSLPELPDAPEGDLLFYTVEVSEGGIYVSQVSEGWQAWFDGVAHALGMPEAPVRIPIATATTLVSAEAIKAGLGEVLEAGKYVNFGRPRLTLATVEATDNAGAITWKKIRSIAALSKSQREEIEGSYRL